MAVMIAAYLNRETRDGRMIKSITIGEPPWPILSAEPKSAAVVGYVAAAAIADDALLVEAQLFVRIPEPDWEHFCLAPTLRNVPIGSPMQMEGQLAAFFVTPRDEWAW